MIDILLNDDFDLRIEDGDFVVGQSDQQHIKLILETKPGDWIGAEWLGVDIGQFLLDDVSNAELSHRIEDSIKNDGGFVRSLVFGIDGKFTLKADYGNV